MSCRPAIMPPTKSYGVRRLDSTEQEVTLLKKATGSECLDKVSSGADRGSHGVCGVVGYEGYSKISQASSSVKSGAKASGVG